MSVVEMLEKVNFSQIQGFGPTINRNNFLHNYIYCIFFIGSWWKSNFGVVHTIKVLEWRRHNVFFLDSDRQQELERKNWAETICFKTNKCPNDKKERWYTSESLADYLTRIFKSSRDTIKNKHLLLYIRASYFFSSSSFVIFIKAKLLSVLLLYFYPLIFLGSSFHKPHEYLKAKSQECLVWIFPNI